MGKQIVSAMKRGSLKQTVLALAESKRVAVSRVLIHEGRPKLGTFISLVPPKGSTFNGLHEMLCDNWQDAWDRLTYGRLEHCSCDDCIVD